jgi:hypothetical protein
LKNGRADTLGFSQITGLRSFVDSSFDRNLAHESFVSLCSAIRSLISVTFPVRPHLGSCGA